MEIQLTPLVQRYLPLVAIGDTAELLSLFHDQPVVDDPRVGQRVGREAFERYVEDARRWLERREARVEHVATIRAEGRAVSEDVLHLAGGPGGAAETALPVAVAADMAGEKLGHVRVYHSLWPLSGRHQVRAPLLPAAREAALNDVVARYHRALGEGDLATMVMLFEPDGVAREPSGGQYTYRGRERLRGFYGALFADGGIQLEHCAVTDDGVRCALEYNAVAWGRTALPPQAGLAVYERGPTGLLAAARIYDDVEPPV
jgi:hypothetical protein